MEASRVIRLLEREGAIARTLFQLAFYATLVCALAWPVPRVAATSLLAIPYALGDVLLVMWAPAWETHALATDPTRLLDGNTFHPARHALLGSEHTLGTLPTFAPVWTATGNPVLAFNVHLLVSVALSGLAMHWLVRRWTASEAAAYAAGIAFAAAPWRMNMWSTAPHILPTAYMPIAVLCLDRTLGRPSLSAVAGGAVALALQIACSVYLGYATLVGVAAFVAGDVLVRGVRGRWAALASAAVLVVTALVLVAPVTLPYLRAPRAEAFGAALQEVPQFKAIARLLGAPWPLAWGWMGLGTLVLASPAVTSLRRAGRRARARTVGLGLALAAAVVLAPGPGGFFGGRLVLHDALAKLLPGFGAIRYTSRFGVLASFAAAALAGLGVARLVSHRGPAAVAAIVALALGAQLPWTVAWNHGVVAVPTGDRVPPVYRWLAAHDEGGPVLELPTDYTVPGVMAEAYAMYFSIYHWSPMLNGYTGYPPAESSLLKRVWIGMPSDDALALLVGCTGLRWLVVHAASPAVDAAWSSLRGVRLRKVFPGLHGTPDHVFEVIDPVQTECAERLRRDDVTLDGNPVAALDGLAGWLTVDPPSTIAASSDVPIGVALANDGDVAWPALAKDPRRRVVLRVRWDPADAAGRADATSVGLPGDVAAGSTRRFRLWLRAPAWPGRYHLAVAAAQGDVMPTPAAEPGTLGWDADVVVGAEPPVPRQTPGS